MLRIAEITEAATAIFGLVARGRMTPPGSTGACHFARGELRRAGKPGAARMAPTTAASSVIRPEWKEEAFPGLSSAGANCRADEKQRFAAGSRDANEDENENACAVREGEDFIREFPAFPG
jgi:hypothetical protein